MTDVLWLLVGVVLLVHTTWSWRGRTTRSRWWIVRPGAFRVALGAEPAVAVWLVGASADALGAPVAATAWLFLLGVVVALLGLRPPRWWGPGWYHALSATARRRAVDEYEHFPEGPRA